MTVAPPLGTRVLAPPPSSPAAAPTTAPPPVLPLLQELISELTHLDDLRDRAPRECVVRSPGTAQTACRFRIALAAPWTSSSSPSARATSPSATMAAEAIVCEGLVPAAAEGEGFVAYYSAPGPQQVRVLLSARTPLPLVFLSLRCGDIHRVQPVHPLGGRVRVCLGRVCVEACFDFTHHHI